MRRLVQHQQLAHQRRQIQQRAVADGEFSIGIRAECKGLCAQCGTNLNEAACTCSAETLDPRLAPLSRLKTKEA